VSRDCTAPAGAAYVRGEGVGNSTGGKLDNIVMVAGGADALSYSLNLSAASLKKSAAGVFTPTTLTASATSQTGTAAPVAYACRFKVYENGSGTASYTSSSDESSKVYTPSGTGVTEIKVEMYLAGGTSTLLKSQIVPVANDGAAGGAILAEGSGGGSVSSTSYATVFSVAATCDGATKTVSLRSASFVNASGGTQTCYAALYLDSTLIAELANGDGVSLAANQSIPIEFSGTCTPSSGSHTFYLKFKSSAGNSVAGGGKITIA
jgi:hypothetical protein